MKKRWRRRVALILSVLMMVSYIPVASYATGQAVTDDGAAAVEKQVQDQGAPESADLTAQNQGNAEETPVLEEAEAEAPFSQSVKVDGVIVTVTAEKGVFPAGSSLQVKKISVPKAVDTGDAEAAYAFDITILDKNGNVIQPNGEAKVSFKTAEVAEFDTQVFHMDGKKAEELAVTEKGKTATVGAESFSPYVLVFTKPAGGTYTMGTGQTVALSTIVAGYNPAPSAYSYYWNFAVSRSSDNNKLTISEAPNGEYVAKVVAGAEIMNNEKIYIDIPYTYSTSTHDYDGEYRVTVTVKDAGSGGEVTPPTARAGLVYNASAQLLFDPGQTNFGKLTYNVDGGTFKPYDASDAAFKRTEAGEYTVNWKLEGDDGNVIKSDFITAKIEKAEATPPEVATDLVYNETDQKLITEAGTASMGKMQYASTLAGATAPTAEDEWYDNYTEVTQKEAGDYYVWYRVVKVVSGTTTVLVEPDYLRVSIAEAVIDVNPPKVATGLVYNETDQKLITEAGTASMGKMQYASTAAGEAAPTAAADWKDNYTAVTQKNAGDYYVWYRVVKAADATKVLVDPAHLTASIAKAPCTAVIKANTGLTYNDGKALLTKTDVPEGATIKVSIDNGDYVNEIPNNTGDKPLDAGNHTAVVKVGATANYEAGEIKIDDLSIAKKKVVVDTEPADKHLRYTGQPQGLIKAGEVSTTGFAYQYRLEDADQSTWTDKASDIQGTEAKEYTVKYKIVGVKIVADQPTYYDLDDENYDFVDEEGYSVSRIDYCYPEIEMIVDDLKVFAKDMTYGDQGTTKYVESELLGGILNEDDWNITYYYAPENATKWEEWGPDETTPVGNYDIKAVVTDPTGWVKFDSKNVRNTFKVNPKAVTVRAFDKWLSYGETVDVTTDFDAEVNGLTPADEANIDNVLKLSFTVKDGETTLDPDKQPWAKGKYAIVPAAAKVSTAYDNYTFEYVDGDLNISESAENKVELELTDYVYGDSIAKPTATAEFGTPTIQWIAEENYSNSMTDQWTDWHNYAGGKPSDAGNYYVRATVEDTGDYPGGQAMGMFTIAKKPATISISNGSAVYTGQEYTIQDLIDDGTVKVTVTGQVGTEKINYAVESNPSKIQLARDYTLTATFDAQDNVNKNYSISVKDGTFTVVESDTMYADVEYVNTDDKDSGHCVFNGERHGIKVTPKVNGNPLPESEAKVYYSLEEFDDPSEGVTNPDLVSQIHAGKYTIWYYIAAKDYEPIKGSAVLDIDKAYLRLAVADKEVTYGTRLDYQDVNYDQAEDKGYVTLKAYKTRAEKETEELPVIEESINGLNEFKMIMKDYDGQMTDIGQYEVSAKENLTSDDYNIRYTTGILTIVQKLVTFTWSHDDNYEFTYDGKEHGITANVFTDDLVGKDKQEGKVEVVYEDTNKFPNSAVDVKRVEDEDGDWSVGTYTAKVRRLTGERAHNYKIDWTGKEDKEKTFESHFKIVPVDLYLTPNDVTILYGDKAEDNGYTAKGLVNDEQADDILLGKPVRYEFVDYERGSDVGNYNIRITNVAEPNNKNTLHAQNYTVKADVNVGGLTVKPRPITMTWSTPNSFQYNGQYHTVKVTKVENDFTGNSAVIPEPTYVDNKKVNAGSYTAVAKLSQQDALNYEILNNSDTYSWKITKRPATIYANNSTIVYPNAPKNKGYYIDKKPLVKNVENGNKLDSIGKVSFKYNYKKNGKPGNYKITPVVKNLNPNYYIKKTVKGKLTVNYKQNILLARGKSVKNNSIRIGWNGVSGAVKYDVYFCHCDVKDKKNTPKKVATVTDKDYRVKKLKAHNCYKFYIVAKNAKGKVIAKTPTTHVIVGNTDGKYTNAKDLKLKKSKVKISRGGTYKIKAKISKMKSKKTVLDQAHGPLLRYRSGNTAVATVSATGVITGKSQGWCKVYVSTLNGKWQEMQVTVK